MELRLLGPIELVGPGGSVDLGGARPARLLAALFTAEGHRLDFDALIERGFDDTDRPDHGRPAIRTAIRRLRKALGDDTIVTQSGGYQLDLTQLSVDIDRFDELIAAGRAATDPIAAISSFRRALDLWRGRPFGELDHVDWLVAERVRLDEAHLLALEGWHEAHLRNGTATEIIPSLEAATIDHPTRERLHRQLMQALYVADRQADALRAFQNYREAMAEAGLEPSADAVALEQRIAVGDPSLRVSTEGRPLRGYRIVERLGEGAFSIVYKGTQPSVGRDVAIKQIRAELANRPDFIRRFEAEAHMVANLEHPYIVPLYDYWREPGSAYLVMRLLPGGNLESSLRSGPWDLARTSRLVEQIGSALAVSHRSGVVHRDVKPANILLDDDGNSYLTDFGIALAESELADPEASLSAGSPAYASPEQLRRERVGPSADVHGLAIAVYEALVGRLPFPDEPNQAALLQRQLHDPIPPVRSARSDLPAAVDDVLQRATAKNPGDRYQTIEEFVTAFETATGESPVVRPSSSATVIAADERNPFKGLRAFDESDASDFTGRDRLVDQLISELGRHRVLAVVGPSGSGKSSVVRAGLLPALRRDAVQGSGDWFVSTLMPGAHPNEELEAALLRVASERPPGLLDVLNDGERGISRAVRQVLPENGQLLLVIDQFEEVFTLCQDEAERRQFLDGLAAAVSEERSRLRVILTLRADFYDRPLRYESIGRLVRDATIPVLPLAADELERAIVDPAHSVGSEYEPGLVAEIMADVNDQPGALPLLQYALTELWERRISGLLTRDAYRQLGGVTGALARQAELLFTESPSEQQDATRRLFRRLVTLGEGTEDTRRRVSRSEFGDDPALDSVIGGLGHAHLLSFDRDPATREPTIEVAHEALIREWPRLRAWLDDDRDGLRTHRHLTDTAQAWIGSGRDAGELYRGARLDSAASWRNDHNDEVNEVEGEFLDASISLRDAEQAAEQDHLDRQTRSNRRLRVLAAVATVIAVIAAVAGVFALQQRSRADDEAASARTRAAEAEAAQQQADLNAAEARRQEDAATKSGRLAGELALENETRAIEAEQARAQGDLERLRAVALSSAGQSPTLSALLAVESHRIAPTTDSLDVLHRVLTEIPGYRGSVPGGPYRAADLLDDGVTLVATGPESVDIWDLQDRNQLRSIRHAGPTDAIIEIIGDEQIAVLGARRDETTLYDLRSGAETGRVDHAGIVNDVSVSADGELLAAAMEDGAVEVWNLDDLEMVWTFDTGDAGAYFARWSTDGSLAVVTLQSEVQLWSVETRALVWSTDPPEAGVVNQVTPFAAAFSPDGTRFAFVSGSLGSEVRTIDVTDGSQALPPVPIPGLRGFPLDEMYWIDDTTVGIPSGGNVIAFGLEPPFDSVDVVSQFILRGQSVDYSAVIDQFVVAGLTGIEFWSADGSGPLERAIPLPPDQLEALAAGGGPILASFAADGSRLLVSTFHLPTPPNTASFNLTRDPPVATTLEPLITIGVGEYTFAVANFAWQMLDADLVPLGPPVLLPFDFSELGASEDGRFVAIGRLGGLADVYRSSGESLGTVQLGDPATFAGTQVGPWFTSDGEFLALSTTDGRSGLWKTDTLERVELSDEFANSWMYALGSWLFVPAGDGGFQRLDPSTMEPVGGQVALNGFGALGYPRVDPTNRFVAASGQEVVKVFDLASERQVGRDLAYNGVANRIEFTADGTQLSVPDGGQITIWNFDTDSWPDIACDMAGRNLTREEWEQLGPRTIEYRATCPQFPIEN